jgi:hypothetical protein
MWKVNGDADTPKANILKKKSSSLKERASELIDRIGNQCCMVWEKRKTGAHQDIHTELSHEFPNPWLFLPTDSKCPVWTTSRDSRERAEYRSLIRPHGREEEECNASVQMLKELTRQELEYG